MKGSEALVIVHLSSLDSYTQQAKEAGRPLLGWVLANNIAEAILAHDGPVYIVDQSWPYAGTQSDPRKHVVARIGKRTGIAWIRFDESEQDWEPFLARLRRRLAKDRVSRVIVGGIWYDPGLETGCASTVYVFLRRFFKARVDRLLVGCESDFEE